MNFKKAYEHLMNGDKIRRKEWNPMTHLVLDNGKVKGYYAEYTHWNPQPDLMTSNEWQIIGEEGLFNFLQAMDALSQKRSITHESLGKNAFIMVDNGSFAICQAKYDEHFTFSYKCITSNDWELIK